MGGAHNFGEHANDTFAAKPFIKWAGSKHSLIRQFASLIPVQFKTYYEPFLGAGSLFLNLAPSSARLSDLSGELVNLWRSVRDAPSQICEALEGKFPEKELFYRIRGARSDNPVTRAAEFIYLNKSCWNGLYRVNKRGEFNVPFGTAHKGQIFSARNIEICSSILNKPDVTIEQRDFEEATKNASEGDFVFFDPPYVTKHNFNGFREYNEKLFSWDDQVRLAEEAKRLVSIGVTVLVSNADHDDIRALYEGFSVHEISRFSTLASDPGKRTRVTEAVFKGNPK